MTPETRKTLLGLISEYGHSLTRNTTGLAAAGCPWEGETLP